MPGVNCIDRYMQEDGWQGCPTCGEAMTYKVIDLTGPNGGTNATRSWMQGFYATTTADETDAWVETALYVSGHHESSAQEKLRLLSSASQHSSHLGNRMKEAQDALNIATEDLTILHQENEANKAALSSLLVQMEAADGDLRRAEGDREEAHSKLAAVVRRRKQIETELEKRKQLVGRQNMSIA